MKPTSIRPSILLATDVVAFGSQYRDTQSQARIRHTMYEHLKEAFSITDLPWARSHREDRGDGVLIVAPPVAPTDRYLDPLLHHLHAVLRHGNHDADARLRLRLALHYGPVHFDDYGVTGPATLLLFRLLEAQAFKDKMRTTGTDVAAIVSDAFFSDAREGVTLINRCSYQAVNVTHKETRRVPAWFWHPPGRN